MALKIRRVVTGHKADGKATVLIDEVAGNVQNKRPGSHSVVVWATDTFPADNDEPNDLSQAVAKTTLPHGLVFRVGHYEPGVAARNHRTDSIDFAVVLSGEIDMTLDDEIVHLKAGDTLIQRGTIHNWINNGKEPCTIAFVLVDAKPVKAGGKTLDATG